jgi:hypothetical protein
LVRDWGWIEYIASALLVSVSIRDYECMSKDLPNKANSWLDLESASMDRILLATNWLNIYGVGFYGIDLVIFTLTLNMLFVLHFNSDMI